VHNALGNILETPAVWPNAIVRRLHGACFAWAKICEQTYTDRSGQNYGEKGCPANKLAF